MPQRAEESRTLSLRLLGVRRVSLDGVLERPRRNRSRFRLCRRLLDSKERPQRAQNYRPHEESKAEDQECPRVNILIG